MFFIIFMTCILNGVSGHTYSLPPTSFTASHPCETAACQPQSCHRLTYNEMWELETKFWDNFLYPASLQQAKAVNSTFFAENVLGRVDITRNFPGRELNTEYLFGLFADPTSISLLNTPVSYEITKFTASENTAAASTVVMFNSSLFEMTVPVTIDTFITWNDQREISYYDATFRWFGFLLDTLIEAAAKKLGAADETDAVTSLAHTLATGICQIHDKHCSGTNQQYESTVECIKFLTENIRFGKDYELGRNTLLCRSVHQQMVRYRPEVHCPHIGPSGGGMCVDDQTYKEKVFDKYFPKTAFIRPTC